MQQQNRTYLYPEARALEQECSFFGVNIPVRGPQRVTSPVAPAVEMFEISDSSSEEEFTVDFIIANKPKTSEVRRFMRENIDAINQDDDI